MTPPAQPRTRPGPDAPRHALRGERRRRGAAPSSDRAALSLLIALVVLPACTDEHAHGADAPPTEAGPLRNPPEAEDLDPAPDAVRYALTAAPATLDVGDGVARDVLAYNGSVPGPTLRANVGDRVTVELTNALDAPTTLHWHGIHVPEDMDGMDPILAGETRTYTFTADAARTAWYHPHVNTDAQVDAGLYGFFVIAGASEPSLEAELLLAFDVLGEVEAAGSADTGMAHGSPPPPPGGDTGVHAGHADLADPRRAAWVVNGRFEPRIELTSGDRARVRVLNASNAAYLDLRAPETRVLAGDQGLRDALGTAPPVLAPGDRVELELRVSDDFTLDAAPYSLYGGASVGQPRAVVTIDALGQAAAPEGATWPFAGAAPSEDPAYTDLVYVLEGSDGDWSINGERWPDVTTRTVPLGSRPVIEVRNLSATRHPFHTHGNAFEVLSVDGVPVTERTFEDTFDVGIRQRVRLRLHADNPGAWMVHCHILGHETGGMMTLLRVE